MSEAAPLDGLPPEVERAFARTLARLRRYYTTAEAIMWLALPHPQLEGARAADLLAAGWEDRVRAIIDRLASDAYL